MKQMTFLDLCSGIGGFRLGLETAGHKCIGYCEYDKFARASYEAMYDTEGEWKAHDVTKLKPEDVPYADIWCFGFPCQDISVAGKQRGLVGKRSGIYYNIIDLLKGKEESAKPSYLLVENVKNLLSINAGFDFASVLSEMDAPQEYFPDPGVSQIPAAYPAHYLPCGTTPSPEVQTDRQADRIIPMPPKCTHQISKNCCPPSSAKWHNA